MNIVITGRHFEITDALRQHINDKINKANKYSHKIIEASVKLGIEKYRHLAEINMQINGALLSAKEETEDMYTSFDRALEKIERQLRKYKGRHTNKTHNSAKAALKRGDNSPDQESAWDEEESFSQFMAEDTYNDETGIDESGLTEPER